MAPAVATRCQSRGSMSGGGSLEGGSPSGGGSLSTVGLVFVQRGSLSGGGSLSKEVVSVQREGGLCPGGLCPEGVFVCRVFLSTGGSL